MAHELQLSLSKPTLAKLGSQRPAAGPGFSEEDARAVVLAALSACRGKGLSATMTIRGPAQGKAVVSMLFALAKASLENERTIGPLLGRVRNHLLKHPLTVEPEVAETPHGPEERRAATAVVREAVSDMLAVLSRSEYAGKLPDGWRPSVKFDWNPERRRSRGGASKKGLYAEGGISLAMHRRVPAGGDGGGEFVEYARIARSPDIGTFASPDWRAVLRALVAHEVSHAAQRAIQLHARRNQAKADRDLNLPHGIGWQRIYALLRTTCVNDWTARAKAEAPKAEVRSVSTMKPAGPYKKPVQLGLFAA